MDDYCETDDLTCKTGLRNPLVSPYDKHPVSASPTQADRLNESWPSALHPTCLCRLCLSYKYISLVRMGAFST